MYRSSSNDVRFVAGAAVTGACVALVALVGLSSDAPTELMQFQRPGFQFHQQQSLRSIQQGLRNRQQSLRGVQQRREGMEAVPLGLVQVGGRTQLLIDLKPRVPSWNPSDNLEYAQVRRGGEKTQAKHLLTVCRWDVVFGRLSRAPDIPGDIEEFVQGALYRFGR